MQCSTMCLLINNEHFLDPVLCCSASDSPFAIRSIFLSLRNGAKYHVQCLYVSSCPLYLIRTNL